MSHRARDEAAEHETPMLQPAETSELLALAQSASGAGTWDLDLTKGLARFCPRSLEILGHPRDRSPELTGAEWAEHIFPGDADRVLAEGLKARESGSDLVTEYRIVRPDGQIGWVRGLGRTLMSADGEPLRSVGLNFDITEQKRAEEKFLQMQSELIHMSRVSAMGTMAETLAHELNQPLTTISNYLSGAKRLLNGQSGEEIEQLGLALSAAIENAHRAGEIIRRLRAIMRRERSEASLVDTARTVRDALGLALVGVEQKGIASHVYLAPDLLVEADHIQIQQVVMNLVRNAVEAMQDCPIKALRISVRQSDGNAIICIDDTGAGIAESARHTLFEPFVSDKEGGMGIGLSISRTIVEAHGGQLWVDHKADGGTCFCFSLPLTTDTVHPEGAIADR